MTPLAESPSQSNSFHTANSPDASLKMSSANPSPHRFLTQKAPYRQRSKPSSLRHAFPAPAQTPKSKSAHKRPSEISDETQRVTPAKRFIVTPAQSTSTRASRAKDKARTAEEWRDTETYGPNTARKKPATRILERFDSIEGSSQNAPADSLGTEPDDDSATGLVDQRGKLDEDKRREQGDHTDAEALWQAEDTRKRRRTSSPAEHSSHSRFPPSARGVDTLQTPIRNTVRFATPAVSASSRRFIIPAPRNQTSFSNSVTGSQKSQSHNRPQFLLSTLGPSSREPAQPLPEHFSPSRKGQKYIPGGLAALVQSWIIETANTGFAAQTRDGLVWGRDREEGVKMRVKIRSIMTAIAQAEKGEDVDCFNGSVVFVTGHTDAGLYNASRLPLGSAAQVEHETRVLLAGQGGARGQNGVKIKERSVIGIRAPLWDIEVDGEKWVVAVDWILLA